MSETMRFSVPYEPTNEILFELNGQMAVLSLLEQDVLTRRWKRALRAARRALADKDTPRETPATEG